jgi:hypothetical protein
MSFETPRACRFCRKLIYFRRNPDGKIIPYNADGSGGHNCGAFGTGEESEYHPHVFPQALKTFPTESPCSKCGRDFQAVPVANDSLLIALHSGNPITNVLFEKTLWPWSLHLCPPDYTKNWDGNASRLKEACIEKDVEAEMALVIGTVRLHCAEIWKTAIQTVTGKKLIGYWDNRLTSGQLVAFYVGAVSPKLITVSCDTIDVALDRRRRRIKPQFARQLADILR